MNNKYQIELDEFRENFKEYKNFQIVLYGIGRYTATLVEGLEEFCFIGLMDKDPANVGKEMFGLPIIDKEKAEQIADIIVINTSETYWEVIYSRIEDVSIPVYYKNGKKAQKKNEVVRDNPYKGISWDGLYAKVKDTEVVSFDFFDTLFMRKVCSPRDVFYLLEKVIDDVWTLEESFTEVRNRAIEMVKKDYTLNELYELIEAITKLSHENVEKMKAQEIELEKRVLVPRQRVLDLFRKCMEEGKEVYLISDMYLPKSFYVDVLKRHGIAFFADNILISNELRKSKSEGTLWEYYSSEILKGRKAFHVGDHEDADVRMPQRYGIDTYLIPNPWNMLNNSSLAKVCANVTTKYDSIVMGNVLKWLFADPFSLSDENGRITIQTPEDMGYVVFGPVILTFLLWLRRKANETGVDRLVFLSRDGYFLKKDYEYLCGLLQKESESCYLTISRQLAMSAAIKTEEDIFQYAAMPYSGSVAELMEDRFGIMGVEVDVDKTLEQYVQDYMEPIKEKLELTRRQYLNYITSMDLSDKCAIVDLGYYGNNQRYLNKLGGLSMPGFYVNANCSLQNPNTKEKNMYACFQHKNDVTGEKSQILKKMIYLESFLTAPYGMVKGISSQGEFLYAKAGNNQRYFEDKIQMNEGVKQFIHDYIEIAGNVDLDIDIEFTDKYYGLCFDKGLGFADNVKQSFWNDNAMMNRMESQLFY